MWKTAVSINTAHGIVESFAPAEQHAVPPRAVRGARQGDLTDRPRGCLHAAQHSMRAHDNEEHAESALRSRTVVCWEPGFMRDRVEALPIVEEHALLTHVMIYCADCQRGLSVQGTCMRGLYFSSNVMNMLSNASRSLRHCARRRL